MDRKNSTAEIYNLYAEQWAAFVRDGSAIYHIYLEKPAIYGMLPDVKGKSVLCIGCGSGEEAGFIRSLGAARVVGVDISDKLIGIAKTNYPDIEFHVMDAEKLEFPGERFDLVFSSLTLHYLESWKPLLSGVHGLLVPEGIFLFSITHPFFSATERTEDNRRKTRMYGYTESKTDATYATTGNYLQPSRQEVIINGNLHVSTFHRPLSSMIGDIVESGFELTGLAEPNVLDAAKDGYPKFWDIHQRIAEFMIFRIRRK